MQRKDVPIRYFNRFFMNCKGENGGGENLFCDKGGGTTSSVRAGTDTFPWEGKAFGQWSDTGKPPTGRPRNPGTLTKRRP